MSDHAPSVAAPPDPLAEALREHANTTFCKYDASLVLELLDQYALRAESVAAPALEYDTTWRAFEAYEEKAAKNGSGMTREQMTGAAMMLGWLHSRALAAAPPALDAARLTGALMEAFHDLLEGEDEESRMDMSWWRNMARVVADAYGAATPASGEPAAPCVRVSNPDQGIDSHWCLTHDAEWLLGAARCVARGSAPPAAGAEPPRDWSQVADDYGLLSVDAFNRKYPAWMDNKAFTASLTAEFRRRKAAPDAPREGGESR